MKGNTLKHVENKKKLRTSHLLLEAQHQLSFLQPFLQALQCTVSQCVTTVHHSPKNVVPNLLSGDSLPRHNVVYTMAVSGSKLGTWQGVNMTSTVLSSAWRASLLCFPRHLSNTEAGCEQVVSRL